MNDEGHAPKLGRGEKMLFLIGCAIVFLAPFAALFYFTDYKIISSAPKTTVEWCEERGYQFVDGGASAGTYCIYQNCTEDLVCTWEYVQKSEEEA